MRREGFDFPTWLNKTRKMMVDESADQLLGDHAPSPSEGNGVPQGALRVGRQPSSFILQQNQASERKVGMQRKTCDTILTIAWFTMDGLWMFGHPMLAMIPAFVAIYCSDYAVRRLTKGVDTVVEFANASWLMMNVSWMLQDVWLDGTMNQMLSYMKGAFLITGVTCITLVGWKHKDALWYFRRFKINK